MKLILEVASRYLSVETGRLIYAEAEPEVIEAEAELAHVPMGFTAIAGPTELETDDDEEAPEADCH